MKRTLFAVALWVVALPVYSAPYAPYQSDLRSKFTREDDRKNLQQGSVIEPRVESGLLFVGNINLAEDSKDEVNLAGIEFVPGIYMSTLNERAQGFLDYSLIGRVWEDSDYNGFSHRLTTSGEYSIVPDWFYLQGHATYSQTIIDPTISYNYGQSSLFARSNLADRAAISATPVLRHEFRDFIAYASYTYGRVWYMQNEDRQTPESPVFTFYKDDSVDQRTYASIATRDPDRAANLTVSYERQASDFDRTVPYRYERLGIDTGLRLTRTLRAVADAGLESDLASSTVAGGLDSTYWHAGVAWRPDTRTELDVRYGQRFFGDAWKVLFSREARYLTLRLSYSQDPDVETRRIGINFDPDELPLPDPDTDLSGFTSYAYIRTDANLTLLAEGARTRVRLDVFDRSRDYIRRSWPDTDTTGFDFNLQRDLGSNYYAELHLRYNDIERGQFSDGEEIQYVLFAAQDWTAMGRFTWEFYSNFIASAEAGYLRRSGDRNYDGQWAAFRFRYTF